MDLDLGPVDLVILVGLDYVNEVSCSVVKLGFV